MEQWVRIQQLSPVIDMQRVACSAGCEGYLWVAGSDPGPYFDSTSCMEKYLDSQLKLADTLSAETQSVSAEAPERGSERPLECQSLVRLPVGSLSSPQLSEEDGESSSS